ncbi:MAG: two-component system response regulator [Bacteroidetes bacterium RIFCSPHIGHO2_02_FULL_44_7]|nr:MAG: two-component system response regulator [Bacteroidetes bacterium RIFCSPHIGHO2_02_FULL_44_7]
MSRKKHILIVEDEENFGSLLQNYLRLSNYEVDWEKDGTRGYSAFLDNSYDLCILDVMMPRMDGFTLAEKIRARGNKVPLIFLTARNMKEDMLRGYRAGADDYLNKPFDIEVLLLKLNVLFNRQRGSEAVPQTDSYRIGNFTYETRSRSLSLDAEIQKLSPKEGALLELLCRYQNRVLPRELALREIWNEDNYFTTRSMDVYITKLRKYLRGDSSVRIENVHSSGYTLYTDE